MRGLAIAVAVAALVTGIVLLAVSPSSPARPSQDARRSRAERRAEGLLARLDRGVAERNPGRLRAVLYRDFIAVREDGRVVERDAFVQAMTSGQVRHRHEIDEVRGGRRTIVAVGRVVGDGAEPRRFTAVLARVGEDWEIAALHTSAFGTEPSATTAPP
jgi:hypothetical protein